ncbi:MAG: T9SS type A sorting domain-containing protein [Cyclobacteriaceae bacterium]|nr:T9SS type A sorting domain-containing protein [Cyclobacteriaceae bacterium HetDA_MAG_MS6]
MKKVLIVFCILLADGLAAGTRPAEREQSIARMWNEVLLEAIRNDFARPTVHARNLFHIGIAMHDSWAICNGRSTYLLGKELHDFQSHFDPNSDLFHSEDVAEVLSHACYTLLHRRFRNSPGYAATEALVDSLMFASGYDGTNTSIDYTSGDPAALGNFIAKEIFAYGLLDGSNEALGYRNEYYEPVNAPLDMQSPGNNTLFDPNRWQPLMLDQFIDQSGNLIDETPEFLSPEWGKVYPFALTENEKKVYQRDGGEYIVYHDPGDPAYLDDAGSKASDFYKWGFSLVSIWSSHLSSIDTVMWDVSPRSIGNIDFGDLPTEIEDYYTFYDLRWGGDIGKGREINPISGMPYDSQWVRRGDYTRVLAEFWADGPDSETPPGHWFTILNYVKDQLEGDLQIAGAGSNVDALEWDVKAYFTLGGAMHDAAVAAWGIKGWYDYVRPVSAIRYMADLGQSSDSTLANYHPEGIPLIDSYIEVVTASDPMAGDSAQNVGKIKLFTWRGPEYIEEPDTDEAGVGWILAENWWPYQRPTFITPPFAGYVSGHSTYSRAAAEVLTAFTGSEYFPGGMGIFLVEKDKFLVFENGPTEDIELQWATYRDASDQCSLSRIWGGIHPPVDDIPGRKIGLKVGLDAFEKAMSLFNEQILVLNKAGEIELFPNPAYRGGTLQLPGVFDQVTLYDMQGRVFMSDTGTGTLIMPREPGVYIVGLISNSEKSTSKIVVR